MNHPTREPRDGAVGVERLPNGDFVITCETDGKETRVLLGGFNVWRVFGTLAMMLQIRLPATVLRSINL